MIENETQRQSMLESVLGAINLGTVVLDAGRRVVVWNRWMSQYSGLTPQDVIGQDFFVLFAEIVGAGHDLDGRRAHRDRLRPARRRVAL